MGQPGRRAGTSRKMPLGPCFGALSGTMARHDMKLPSCLIGLGRLVSGHLEIGSGGPFGIL
jgi:hypothetical protein